MEIKQHKELDIQNIAGDFGSIEASIDSGSMSFLFEMMSKSLYSNPIGSIVRELTSNCFDSHREAKIDKPVVISKLKDDEGTYISFKDVGVGLSPDRVRKIYMNYFSSTKRTDNTQIGGFGLGSKTPFAYTDYFYITTTSNKKIVNIKGHCKVPLIHEERRLEVLLDKGIKYQYLFSKGERAPTLDLLDEDETDDRNGTEIKIYIKSTNDEYKFKEALQEQLCYFDNVYFVNWDIDNHYYIYETDLYKYRNTSQYSDEMHICFGTVPYPIDWKIIDEHSMNIPVGIKFEIGELVVTPNRESLRYTDEVKELVKERVKQVRADLIKTYQEQNKPLTDYKEWYRLKKSKPFIKFGGGGNEDGSGDDYDKLYLSGIKEVDKKFRLELFEDVEYFYNFDDHFRFLYDVVKSINYAKEDKYTRNFDFINNYVHSYNNKYSIVKHINTSNIKNAYFTDIFLLKKITCAFIDDIGFIKSFIVGRLKEKENTYDYDENLNKVYCFGDGITYFNLGYALKVYKVNQKLRELFESTNNCVNYDDIPEDYIKKYKDQQRENNASLQRKLEGKVFVKDIIRGTSYDWKVSDIARFKGIVVYGNRDDMQKLEQAEHFFSNFKTLTKYITKKGNRNNFSVYDNKKDLQTNKIKIILISKQNEKPFKNRTNMIHVEDLYSDHKLFRRLASCYKIENFFKSHMKYQSTSDVFNFITEIYKINKGTGELLKTLYRYREENQQDYRNGGNHNNQKMKREILEIANEHNLFDSVITNILEEAENWFKDVEILKYTDINEDSLPAILLYLRSKGKKLNYDYYCKHVYKVEENKVIEGQITLTFEEEEESTETKFRVLTKVA